LTFHEQAYQWLWDEPILNQLNWLFEINPPKASTFGDELSELRRRADEARLVNDLFFRILDRDASVEKLCNALQAISPADPSLVLRLKSANRLEPIRKMDISPSEKIAGFMDFLREDFGLDLSKIESISGCLQALKIREGVGAVNTLLVKTSGEAGLVVPLQIMLQPGSGQVYPAINVSDEFRVAIERARLAVVKHGFLNQLDGVIFSLDLTEPEYRGPSICLAAAVGMYATARRMIIDPYTAFTGDIILDRGHWFVRRVSGLTQKLNAARLNGCRRVFVPRANEEDMDPTEQDKLQILLVDELLEVLLQLQAPLQPLPGDSLQIRKINALQAFCQDKGWELSPFKPIQGGLQFRIIPLLLPQLAINIYNTGNHTPKDDDHPEYLEVLNTLQEQEDSRIPIKKIEAKFNLGKPSLRGEIREALEALQPTEQRQEEHCEYLLRFERGQERLVVKQYEKGTLQIQGTAGELYKAILECIVPRYNLHYPNAQIDVEELLGIKESAETTGKARPALRSILEVPIPHIGTDESGKGDYFGPMVVAGVFFDPSTKPKLESLGLKDSKLLSDRRCRELAARIRESCRGKYEEVEIMPERYNELYDEFRAEGKNLNHLLAWGHARAIESLLKQFSCSHAVADQFGDERYILSRLMEKGKHIHLVQLPKGERYVAVAAASILARDRFLARMEKLGHEYGIELPKGASQAVVPAARRVVNQRGQAELRKVAKLHHKTTAKIIATG
jgi:ribonuclease HIII